MSSLPRNVILDLLPAYIAGEASAETRALVDEYAQSDPQIARLIRSGAPDLTALTSGETPHAAMEKQAMLHVRRRVRKQAWHLGLAIFCTFLSIIFQWNSESGFHWTWQEHPFHAILFALFALFFWLAYFHSRARLKTSV